MSTLPYTVSGNTLTIITDDVITITSSHPNFQRILEQLRGPDAEAQLPNLLDPYKAAREFTNGRIHFNSPQPQLDMVQRFIDADWPGMRHAVTNFLAAAPEGFYVNARTPLLYNGNILVARAGGAQERTPKAQIVQNVEVDLQELADDDRLVFEQILEVGAGEDDCWRFLTSYRTLSVPKARLPFLTDAAAVTITDFNRNIEVPGVKLGIEFLRAIATHER